MMLTTIGLMSGTSLDGVDVALIETDGKQIKAFGPTGYRPYSERERSVLRQALAEAAVYLPHRDARPGTLAEAERLVTLAHAEAVATFNAQNRIAAEAIDIVGFHGQTVLHRPDRKLTVQIGDAKALAKAIHIPVMHDFRAADVEAGGQGAPLVPVYHRALAQSLGREGPIALVNIGGVSNITYIDGDTLIACDTGPGNALLDDYMFRLTRQSFDCDGQMAAQGVADEAWVARALELPFFALPPPKSLDRNDFAGLNLSEVLPADGAATLTALTAAAIARIVPLLPKPPKSWIVAGGGARNHTMMRMLRQRLAPAAVEAADSLGWSSDAIEAQAFGFLAARGMKGLPLSYPATTGVSMPMTGGIIARP
jgi:anhydro-N-acetylmuramic acid kinase